MPVVAWLSVTALIVALIVIVNRAIYRDTLSPLNLLLFSWIVPLLMNCWKLSTLQPAWPLDTWLAIVWVTFALVTCALLPALSSRPAPRKTFDGSIASEPWFVTSVLALYVIAFGAYLYNEFVTNPVGIPAIAFLRDPNIPREAFHRWGKSGGGTTGVIALVAAPVLPLSALCVVMADQIRARWRRIALWMMGFAYLLATILKLSRVDFLQALILIVIVRHYASTPRASRARRRVRVLGFAAAGAGAIALFVYISSLRGGLDTEKLQQMAEHQMGITTPLPYPLNGLAIEGYAYFALPFENFAAWHHLQPNGSTQGIGLLRPVYALYGLGAVAESHQDQLSLQYPLWPVNTYPLITMPILEGGAIELVLTPLLAGLVVAFFYQRLRSRPTLRNALLYAMCSYYWMWLFSSAGITVPTFYMHLAIIAATFALARVLRTFVYPPFVPRRARSA